MTTWSDRLLPGREGLAWATSIVVAGVAFVAQLLLNDVFPPNHNDFVGFNAGTSLLWQPWFYVEGLLNHVTSTPVYFELVSFFAVSVTLVCLFAMVKQASSVKGGMAALIFALLAPFTLSAAKVVPLPSLFGLMLTAIVLALSFARNAVAVVSLVLSSILIGFFPLYGLAVILTVGFSVFLAWIGFGDVGRLRSAIVIVSVLPSLVSTLYFDWEALTELYSSSFSMVSATLPAGFSLPVIVTWFGPVALLLAVVAVAQSVRSASGESPVFVSLTVVGLFLFTQQYVDPLLLFAVTSLGVYGLCGVGTDRFLSVEFKERYSTVIHAVILTVFIIGFVNMIAFQGVDVGASRPPIEDVRGYKLLGDQVKDPLFTAPREGSLAKYYARNVSVSGRWQVIAEDDSVFDERFVTDLVEKIPRDHILVVSNWVNDRYDVSVESAMNDSQCFTKVFELRQSSFSAWRNNCVIEDKVTQLSTR